MADRKEQLKSMLQHFINDQPEAAQLDFHQYVSDKMTNVSGKEKKEIEAEVE